MPPVRATSSSTSCITSTRRITSFRPGSGGDRSFASRAGSRREMHDHAAMARVEGTTIRPWQGRDREEVQGLLRLLSHEALVSSEDAPTYVAERNGRLVVIVTLCVLSTLK